MAKLDPNFHSAGIITVHQRNAGENDPFDQHHLENGLAFLFVQSPCVYNDYVTRSGARVVTILRIKLKGFLCLIYSIKDNDHGSAKTH